MISPRLGIRSFALLVLLTALAVSPGFAATAYTFEMIIFERPEADGGEFWPDTPGRPDRSTARDIATVELSPANRRLGPVAFTLKQRGMIIHEHVAWRETPGPRNTKRWWAINAGRLSGNIRVTRGRFLHLDTDLLLRRADAGQSYRVRLNRRMRSDELHYVDHPKLGIVIRATRVAAPAPQATEPDAGEPKPATPAGSDG